MIPCWTAPMVVPVEEIAKVDPTIKQILDEIISLNEQIKRLDLRLNIHKDLIADVTRDAASQKVIDSLDKRIEKLEKRHTLHRHWTEMGR